jgi:thymidylate synthase
MLNRDYEDLLLDVYEDGIHRPDRTGTGTRALLSCSLSYDIGSGYLPLITTKQVHFPSILGELLWMVSGSTNANELREKYGVTIWDEWADEVGNLGPIYGAQWRSWRDCCGRDVDQMAQLVDNLKSDPYSRRHIVSAWNVADLNAMALAPCHLLMQFFVMAGELHCQVYQRSADLFLGVPFNIASYAMLLTMVAQQVDLQPGMLYWQGGDCHIYDNHMTQVGEQLERDVREFPRIEIEKAPSLFEYTPQHFELIGYDPHPRITAPVAV